jgi:hypothetical protein
MTFYRQATASQDCHAGSQHQTIQGYASVLDYEAHILVRSMYFETRMGTMPIDPAHFVGRFALKYVTKCFHLSMDMEA